MPWKHQDLTDSRRQGLRNETYIKYVAMTKDAGNDEGGRF